MNDIEISVYIPNYNYGEYLDKAIKSLLKQTFKRFEIIIIDDGSTDRSSEVIKKYTSQKNYKIRLIQHKNKGLIKSSNIAIRASKGKFIMRLDADDYLKDTALEKFYNLNDIFHNRPKSNLDAQLKWRKNWMYDGLTSIDFGFADGLM